MYNRLIEKADAGKISAAEVHLLINGFDQAELYQYEQARELSISHLKEWLVKYKFKNWKVTRSRKIKVTTRMKKLRASQIAKVLNNTERWHSHGYGISKDVLENDINVMIDDFGKDIDLSREIRDYHDLLSDLYDKTKHNRRNSY